MSNERPENVIPFLKCDILSPDQFQENGNATGDRDSGCLSHSSGLHIIGEEIVSPANCNRQGRSLSFAKPSPHLPAERAFLGTP
jgi:hypothetical protein